MDDLRLLREWRAEVPEPDGQWIVPQRRRLLTRMRRRGRTLALRLVTVAAAGAAAAALAVVVLPAGPSGTEPASGPSSTVSLDSRMVLARAAEVAGGRGAAPVPEPTQWHYTRSLDKQPNSDETRTFESWIRYDGKQAAGYDEDGTLRIHDALPDPDDDDLSPQQYDAKLRELPTDPRKLLAKVTKDRHWIDYPHEEGVPKSVEPDADRAYRVIMLYLSRYGTMPPRLEAAMFKALALIPDVRVESGVTDAAGRAGLGVYREGRDKVRRGYHILDPDTYRYLGEKIVWLQDEHVGGNPEPAFRKGSVYATALLTSVIVDRPGERG
ncbi:CU044_5270 family protein [Microbispora hainanensis]|uniref:CU044_5270 family protein n=1 Tax=Microbispora hainanensis TaxID=568844 RepID=A0A544YX11_9ACTN|nr:CU044_5270 family protein [Microbispora hainanensis]TQS21072.1 hypothetical protein FLX08_13205 [Microbispora hainanensis]